MKILKTAILISIFAVSNGANAAVVEVGDLNIINDAGNASDGLRFLDMSYSDGLSLAAALTNAQATYANARLATATEWDDLFAAAGIAYNTSLTASDAFTPGPLVVISEGSNYDSGALGTQLGTTNLFGTTTLFWSDPDGDVADTSTRDYMSLGVTYDSAIITHGTGGVPPNGNIGWLLVSDVSAVPIPAAAWLFGSALLGLAGIKRKRA